MHCSERNESERFLNQAVIYYCFVNMPSELESNFLNDDKGQSSKVRDLKFIYHASFHVQRIFMQHFPSLAKVKFNFCA